MELVHGLDEEAHPERDRPLVDVEVPGVEIEGRAPGSRTPRRTYVPGTSRVNHAKSSPPQLCSTVTTDAAPTTVSPARRTVSVTVASFTTGGTPWV